MVATRATPRVTGLGHAGLRIDVPDTGLRVLADPWFARGGAFLGSWFPFPDNAHLRATGVLDADVVVVSHEHLDHLDLGLIAGVAEARDGGGARLSVDHPAAADQVDRARERASSFLPGNGCRSESPETGCA